MIHAICDAPIIFCHYGASKYLDYVLPCAQRNNPDKQVVLLGDASNKSLCERHGIHHFLFDDFDFGPYLQEFNKVFQVIMGPDAQADPFWLKFVFKRWFFVYNFVHSHSIHRFWHFDSDNMILEKLSGHEHYFADVDCTEQCNGGCMNGYVGSPAVLTSYIEKIIELFQRPDYLESQQKEIYATDPRGHFNEMRAYATFRKEESFRSERLFKIRDGAIFDDCLMLGQQFETTRLRTGEAIKQVAISDAGGFYGRTKDSQEQVRFVSLNLSWLPLYVYKIVLKESVNSDAGRTSSDASDLTQIENLRIPIAQYLKYKVRNSTRAFRRPFSKLIGR